MTVTGFLKRVFSRSATARSGTPEPVHQELTPLALELLAIISLNADPERMESYAEIVGSLEDKTIREITVASNEHEDYDAILTLQAYDRSSHPNEEWLRYEAFFHGVAQGSRNGWYYFEEAVNRLREAEPAFNDIDFADLDEPSRKHALALFTVIFHFIQYKGITSPDTSSFLKGHPEMAERVIDFIEQRGIGMGGFNTEVFNMAKASGVQVLDNGVL